MYIVQYSRYKMLVTLLIYIKATMQYNYADNCEQGQKLFTICFIEFSNKWYKSTIILTFDEISQCFGVT